MDTIDREAQTVILPKNKATTQASISNKWINSTRLGWSFFAILCVGLFAVGLPARFTLLLELTPEQAEALTILRISPGFRAWWLLSLEILLMLGFSIIGLSIYLQKPNEWMTTFVSLLMIAFGTTILNSMNALGETFPNLIFTD